MARSKARLDPLSADACFRYLAGEFLIGGVMDVETKRSFIIQLLRIVTARTRSGKAPE